MENEKCFCHFNGFKVKDADARIGIETLNNGLEKANTNINKNVSAIETNKSDITTLNKKLNDTNTNVEGSKINIATLQTSVSTLKYDNNANKTKIAELETTLNNIGEVGNSVAEINAKIETNRVNIESNTNRINALSSTVDNVNHMNMQNASDIQTLNNDIQTLEDGLHKHDNKGVLDGITNDDITKWNKNDEYIVDTEVLTEKVWVGKPVYRKIIKHVTAGTSFIIDLADLNFDSIFLNKDMSYVAYWNVRLPINHYTSATFFNSFSFDGTKIGFTCGSGYDTLNKTFYLVLEYTKAS